MNNLERLPKKHLLLLYWLCQSLWLYGSQQTEAETPTLWPPDVKKWLIGKDPHAGKDWRQEEKGTREDEMVGWPHWLDGHEFEQALGVGGRQGGLACCSPWGPKGSDTTERLSWNVHLFSMSIYPIFFPCLSIYLLSISFFLSIFYLCLSVWQSVYLHTYYGYVSVENSN